MTQNSTLPQNHRILVIDDNPEIHHDFHRVLAPRAPLEAAAARLFGGQEPISFEIDCAEQGKEGLALVQRARAGNRPYAIAFVDVRMPPGWDGIETTKRLWEADPDLEIVICTAYSDYSFDKMCASLGCSNRLLVLKKPFDAIEVTQLANTLREKWRLGRDSRNKTASLESVVARRTTQLESARIAALNMMEDAVKARERAEASNLSLQRQIAESKQLEEQLRQAQKMEAIGRLAGGVAHDFNNLLAVILLRSELLAQQPGLSQEILETLDVIVQSTKRATDLTRRLLLFSRREVMLPKIVDLNDSVTQLSRILRRIIGEDIQLQLNLAPRPIFLRADPGMLDQVALNFAVNSRDAMPSGGLLVIETAEESFTADELAHVPDASPGRYVRLSVRDSGCGIAPESLPRIFEPFYTTKEPGKGTGLGLSIVFGIVKQHGGWIDVVSELGKGATFHVHLPACDPPANPDAQPASSPASRGGGETVLLVVDETHVRAIIREILQRNGYRVLEALQPSDAIALADQGSQFDLLLTDIVLPGGRDGRAIAAQLQARRPQLKVIFISGYSSELGGRALSLQPGQRFLQKPFPAQRLLETVRLSLDG